MPRAKLSATVHKAEEQFYRIFKNVSATNFVSILFNFQVDTFTSVYKKLTGRDVTFEFPEPYL
jgi:hypothetical protein